MSKSFRLIVLTVLALLLVSVSTLAQTGVTSSIKNPLQIAILHWYKAKARLRGCVETLPSRRAIAFRIP